ncbi:hypothetical protein [Sulfuriroseicoccus oceanibius]|uniref:Uncharacterized protein n=1 Tax=Sulfuriroseicoccus oceanibius TaxID=2707525 RepID=A0A6B3LA58_9BACT|nr:hypothetical protein [Sulfuriroseicoccus oceanibius]QQL44584.1 hypothetical protein G3M56_011935 [Sulfuriroseicoccus oceanibius]
MNLLADIEIGRIVSVSLIAMVVPIVLGFLYRSAQRDSHQAATEKRVDYPKTLKILVWAGWGFTIAIAIIAAFTARGHDFWPAFLCVLLFVGLTLSLHLEAYFVTITWDDGTIYTRSPWRCSRMIPLSSVRHCDFSQTLQWYRIRTQGYGIVRLHIFARGIPQLLAALPVPNPGYPPKQQNQGEQVGAANRDNAGCCPQDL